MSDLALPLQSTPPGSVSPALPTSFKDPIPFQAAMGHPRPPLLVTFSDSTNWFQVPPFIP